MMEVYQAARYQIVELNPHAKGYAWCFYIAIEANRTFLLDSVYIAGLASNLIDGTFRLEDASRGRTILELPLIWWATRPRRSLHVPYAFPPASTLRFTVGFKEIRPAFDLLGRPREIQKLYVMFTGRDVYPACLPAGEGR